MLLGAGASATAGNGQGVLWLTSRCSALIMHAALATSLSVHLGALPGI
jgi:hypothetical protein